MIPAAAWIELSMEAAPVSVIWRETPNQRRGRLIVAGELVAADASADDDARQALADVIWDSGSPSRAVPPPWLGQTLRAFPGCAVAASWRSRDVCAVATRQGPLAISVCGADELGASFRLFACAAFVHGWLSARWPIALLCPGRVLIRAGSPATSPGTRWTGDGRTAFSLLADGRPPTRPAGRCPSASV